MVFPECATPRTLIPREEANFADLVSPVIASCGATQTAPVLALRLVRPQLRRLRRHAFAGCFSLPQQLRSGHRIRTSDEIRRHCPRYRLPSIDTGLSNSGTRVTRVTRRTEGLIFFVHHMASQKENAPASWGDRREAASGTIGEERDRSAQNGPGRGTVPEKS